MLLNHFVISESVKTTNQQVPGSRKLERKEPSKEQSHKEGFINKHTGWFRAGWLGLAMLGMVWASTAFGAGCDPVIEGLYVGKTDYAAVYSSCTTTVASAEKTVSINYHRGGYIYTVTASPSQYLPPAPASTASIGSLITDAYKADDMGIHYKGNCQDMKGEPGSTPDAIAGHYYCFYFHGSDADLFLGGYLTETNLFERGTASIVGPPTADDFITTWKTDNPGTSGSTSITVPMVGGPYDVDWDDDGTFDEMGLSGVVTHDYGATGTYTIRIRGTYDAILFNNSGDKEKILSLDQWGTNSWTSMHAAFYGAVNLTLPATDTPDFSVLDSTYAMFRDATSANPQTGGWDTSAVISMAYMFSGASSANPNTSGWVTSAVTTMHRMFRNAASASPNTSGWDTSLVTDMAYMFDGASVANPDTSGWVTSAVTTMGIMFDGATAANPDTSGWDTSAVTNMNIMFRDATSANPDTSGWNTSLVTTMSSMFDRATSANPNTSGWNTSSVTSMKYMFRSATSANPDTSGWATSAVIDMAYMFDKAALANPDTSGWVTSAVLNMGYMFQFATSANPDTSNWNTAAVVDMTAMFNGATSFDQDIGSWDVTALTYAANMFLGVTISTENYDSLLIGWDAQVLQTGVPFTGGNSTYCSDPAVAARANMIASDSWSIVDGGQSCPVADPADDFVTTWKTDNPGTSNDTSITVPMVGGPYDVDWEDDGTIDETGLSGSVTHDYGVADTYTIRIRGSYDSIAFNDWGDKEKILSLEQWGTNKWTTMDSAFSGAVNLTVPATDAPDLSAVHSMKYMFFNATKANPDTSGWNTSGVWYMSSMFNSATMANPDTSSWDTANVEGMASMFRDATSANPDVSGWNTAAVANMSNMFQGASSFDQDLGSWDVAALTSAENMFNGVTLSTVNYESLLIGWDARVLLPNVKFHGGNSTYCSESAVAARANMIASDSWVITDGGQGCATTTFTVGGNVSGLVGSGLVLQNKATDDLAISANGDFTFATALDDGVAYVVTILTQPADPIQVCSVSNGSGNLDGADIVDVTVTCVDEPENIFTDGFEE